MTPSNFWPHSSASTGKAQAQEPPNGYVGKRLCPRADIGSRSQPGERIPSERALSEELGFSRGSIRDALRDLAQKGLISRKPGSGTIVQAFDSSLMGRTFAAGLTPEGTELLQVMEVRVCIEPPLAQRAASRATDRDITQLGRIVEDTRGVDTATEFAVLDRSFHLAIAQYTYNPLLVSLLDRVHELTAPSRSENLLTRSRISSSVQEHQAIVEAIAARDPQGAFDAAAAHIASIQARIIQENPKMTIFSRATSSGTALSEASPAQVMAGKRWNNQLLWLMMALTFGTGIVDAVGYLALNHVFIGT